MRRRNHKYGAMHTVLAFVLSLTIIALPTSYANAMVAVSPNDDASTHNNTKPTLKRHKIDDTKVITRSSAPKISTESYDSWKEKMDSSLQKATNSYNNGRYVSIKSVIKANINLPQDAIVKIVAAQYGYNLETAELVTMRAIDMVQREVMSEQAKKLRPIAVKPIGTLPPVVTLPYEHPVSTIGDIQSMGTHVMHPYPVVDTTSQQLDGTAWKEIDIPVVYADPVSHQGATNVIIPIEDFPTDPSTPILETE